MKLSEADFKLRFPIGAEVHYFPIKGEPEFEETRIRSEPWALGHGAVVVAVEGRTGGVLIEHIRKALAGRAALQDKRRREDINVPT